MEIWRHHCTRGRSLLSQQRYADASREFEQALALAPDEPLVLLAVGRERLRAHRFGSAEPVLRRAYQRLPNSGAAAATLARLLGLHRGKLPEAYSIIEAALARTDDPGPLHVINGELLLEEGAFVAARGAFARAADHTTTGEAARQGLARCHNAEGMALTELGRPEEALFAFKRAADLDPGWAGPLVNQGVTLGRMGKPERALEAYTDALERNPANAVAYLNLGLVLGQLDRHEEALQTLEALVQVAPDYPGGKEALANVLGELKRFDDAIALLLEALEETPQSAGCWSSLGLAYVCTGEAEHGERCLLRALDLDPGHVNAAQNLLSLYATQQDFDKIQALLQRVRLQAEAEPVDRVSSTD